MLTNLIIWDQNLFLYLNGLHHPYLDPIMEFVSKSEIPIILLFFFFIIYGFKKFNNTIFAALFFMLVAIGISDGLSSGIFKPTFKRLRPCKERLLKEKIYIPSGKCLGGKYGFFSSHASNSFTVAIFFWLLFRRKHRLILLIFPYAGLVSYSRIYLAKHYPLDLIVGMLFGLLIGYVIFKIFLRFFPIDQKTFSQV